MKISDEQVLPATREVVWEMLNDADVLRACIPGCEKLDGTEENAFTATVHLKVGPIKVRFAGNVELCDLNPPESYSIVGEGKGGVAGFAKGRANIILEDHPEGTLLKYDVDVQIGGKLAQLGNRLIDSTSRKLAGKFFACFAEKVSADA
jgi:carbon monoxide dehydrogenase subunit G